MQARTFLVIDGSNKKKKSATDSSNCEDDGDQLMSAISSLKGLQQSNVPNLFKKKDKEQVDNILTKFFCIEQYCI